MSSPDSHIFEQEKDLFKTISASVESSSNTAAETGSPLSFSDDIGHLLQQMVQILPIEERNIFCTGNNEEKKIEEIIQEANELIRSTTPLFSSSDSFDRNLKVSYCLEEQHFNKSLKTANITEEHLKEQAHSERTSSQSSFENIPLKEIVLKREAIPVQNRDKAKADITNNTTLATNNEYVQPLETGIITAERTDKDDTKSVSESIKVQPYLKQIENVIDIDISDSIKMFNYISNKQENCIQVDSKHRDISPMYSPTLAISHKDCSSAAIGQENKDQAEVLKLTHLKYAKDKEWRNQNHQSKIKLKEANIDSQTIDDSYNLECLKSEMKNQEQLLSVYEKENRKLCKEIVNLKEIWKQKETKLIEEKQRLKNELQGMVSKVATEALEEQLKDARETIVKFQVELTSYKGRTKELETSCEQLRSERLRLETELSQCWCDRSHGRRDKYSFLASSNVGAQIHQLKAVITRKDDEITKMAATLELMKDQVNNKQQQNMNIPVLLDNKLDARAQQQAQNSEKESLLKENADLKRQVRELETIVRRRQRSDLYFPGSVGEPQSRLVELEKELSSRQDALASLHLQFLTMQKKYESHIHELEARLKESKEEVQNLKTTQKKETLNNLKSNMKKTRPVSAVVKEETHLLATIRGLRQEATNREKEMNKLSKELEEIRQTNKRLQKEREKQLTCISSKMPTPRDKSVLKKVEKSSSNPETQVNLMSVNNNNINITAIAELQETNIVLKSKVNNLQEEVKRLEQDLIAMHKKRVHDLTTLQREHELEVARLTEERSAFLSQGSTAELQGQLYTQQMIINHLKNRLKQMEELKNEVPLLRAERDHLEESLSIVNKKLALLQNSQSPESIQYKTLLEKLETLEKNQEIREQKLNSVRELLSRSTQGQSQGTCGGTCRDKLLDKNRQICFYRAQMDRILESLLDIRRTK